MRNTNLAFNEGKESTRRVIELSESDCFPVTVRLKDDSNRVVADYRIVKTRRNGLMLQK